ncbi:MAG: glycosyltransferase family 4 protein [Candidatus Omnitrophica bacterium]|nr:glycosyltransferase family 4 protein [Candidatus Omnitrophota bacterium]
MRILLLSQWFQPELSFKGLPFARELTRLGHDVQVLTGFPNYPGGKIYKGYKIRLFQKEILEGIPVFRVPLYPSHDNNSLRRIANYASFAFSAASLGVFGIKRPDVIHAYHPPATIGLPALFLRMAYHSPFVYDIQDLWPDTLAATGMVNNKMVLRLVGKWCNFIYSQAAKIVVLSPGFKEELIKRGVPEHKIEVIYNWCEEDYLKACDLNEDLTQNLGMAGRFNIVFAGTMGKAQALSAVLDTAGLLKDKFPEIQFIFVGGGVDVGKLKKKKIEQNLTNVCFLPWRPMSEIGHVLNSAHVLLVHLKDDPLFKITIPGKTQAYMAAGRPILMAVKGNAAELIEKAGAGLVCMPQDPQGIAKTVETFYKMPREKLERMGENGRNFYQRELSLCVGVQRFEKVFKSAINKI